MYFAFCYWSWYVCRIAADYSKFISEMSQAGYKGFGIWRIGIKVSSPYILAIIKCAFTKEGCKYR